LSLPETSEVAGNGGPRVVGGRRRRERNTTS